MEQLSLLNSLVLVFIVVTIIFYNRIHRQAKQINEHLKDIAKSQRILAKNPKDFEETKIVNAQKNQSPYDS